MGNGFKCSFPNQTLGRASRRVDSLAVLLPCFDRMPTPEELKSRLDVLMGRVREACARSGRDPASVRVLPVTKTHPAEFAALAHALGFPAVAENRVQEAAQKRPLCPPGLRWELIGHLQSNKAKAALQTFDVIQSVDSAELAARLGRLAAEAGLTREVLIQVNSGRDPAKFGCELEEAPAVLEAALAWPALKVRGLMAVAPLSDDMAVADRAFSELRLCRDRLAQEFGVSLPELSMGMSGDLESAVAAGSTCLRVGSALFGARPSA